MNDVGDLVRAVQAAPLLAGRLAQLEDHGERRHAAEAAFGLGGPEAHGRKGAFDGIGGANVLPVLGREVVDGEQHVAVLGQAGHRFVVLGARGLEEEVEGLLGHRAGLGHPDVLSVLLGAWLDGLRELVEHVGGLVHPTALLARRPVDLAQGFPETKRPVAGGQLGRNRQAAALEIEQHFAPGLGALPVAVGDRQSAQK